MLRYAIRRILWAIPTLLATSLVLFLVTTLAPAPATSDDPFVDEGWRSQFLDVPRFVNTSPQDVRARAAEAVAHISAGDAGQERAARRLAWLGGAALPYVLPAFEALAPDARGRLAVALAPVAERTGIARDEVDLTDPEQAVLFWSHFWDDRALDFTATAVERAVDRLVNHGSEMREADSGRARHVRAAADHARAAGDERSRGPAAPHAPGPPLHRARRGDCSRARRPARCAAPSPTGASGGSSTAPTSSR